MLVRAGEKDKTHFRSERFENINGQWFFRIREAKKLEGPYKTQKEVQKAAHSYLKDMKGGKSDVNTTSHRYLSKAFSIKQ